jgi:hypothetical protein
MNTSHSSSSWHNKEIAVSWKEEMYMHLFTAVSWICKYCQQCGDTRRQLYKPSKDPLNIIHLFDVFNQLKMLRFSAVAEFSPETFELDFL